MKVRISTVILLTLGMSAVVTAELTWTQAPYLSTGRTAAGVTTDSSGNVCAIGGWQSPGNITNTVEVLVGDTWQSNVIPSMNLQRMHHRAVTDSSGCIWAIGGGNGSSALDSVERYCPDATAWEIMTDSHLNTPRYGPGAAVLDGHEIYVFGGISNLSYDFLSSTEKYDVLHPELGWQPVEASMNEARGSMGCAVDLQGRIYAIGGGNVVDLQTVEMYDPIRNVWEYVAPLPDMPHNYPAAFTLNGEIWVVGGWYHYSGLSDKCFIYNPDTNSWREGPTMYEPLVGADAAISSSGIPYVVGGQRGEGAPGSDHVAMLIPEPITVLLLVLGGLTGLRKRRS